jgi:transcription initiation factor IIE alpha subunit
MKQQNETIYINPDIFLMLSCLDERFKIIDYLLKNRTGKYCIATQKDIAQNTNLSIHSVRTFINRLKEKKIITKHSQGIYELLIPIEKSKIVFNTPQSPIDDF